MPAEVPRLSNGTVAVTLAAEADAPLLLDFHRRNQAHLAPWLPPLPGDFLTLGYWRRWSQAAETLWSSDQAARLLLRREGAAQVLGQINLSSIQRGAFQAALVGYHVDAAEEGRGLMRQGMELVIGLAFGEMKLHRLMANHMPNNERSARLLRRLGFEVEGYARDYLYIDGAWRDHVLTALVAPAGGRAG